MDGRRAILLFFFICIHSLLLQGQQRMISGYLRDTNTGEGLPGATLIVKGTKRGTVTGIDGAYRLKVFLGDVVVIFYIGMKTREILVTRANSSPLYQDDPARGNRPAFYDYTQQMVYKDTTRQANKEGVGILNKYAPTYKISRKERHLKVYKIKFSKRGKNRRYVLKNDIITPRRNPWRFEWQQTGLLKTINRLPRLQNSYAQGRPIHGNLQWRGAESGEVFSWGPAIGTLGFDGNATYAYDKNGALVQGAGTQSAKAYDPTRFFRTGASIQNTLRISKATDEFSRLFFQANDLRTWHPVPRANTRTNYLKLGFVRQHRELGGNAQISYDFQQSQLPLRGATWQNIVGSVLTTPPTFDQANDLKRRQALGQSSTYLLGDGTQRSPAPGLIDNPYGLVNQMPDYETRSSLTGGMELWRRSRLEPFGKAYVLMLDASMHFELTELAYLSGQPVMSLAAPSGRMIQRMLKRRKFESALNMGLECWDFSEALFVEPAIRQEVRYENYSLDRVNAFGFTSLSFGEPGNAAQRNSMVFNNFRQIYQILPSLKFRLPLEGAYRDITLRLATQHYFSSTLPSNAHIAFLPAFQFQLRERIGRDLRINASIDYTQNIKEAPLLYNQWQYNSTNTSLANYAQYFEQAELVHIPGLLPEKNTSWHTTWVLKYKWHTHLSVSYFHTKTENFLVPQLVDGKFSWTNAAEIANQGWEFKFFTKNDDNGFYWTTQWRWAFYRPMVKQVYSGTSVPLAGYQEAGAYLVAGQPYGAIYGTRYLRNEASGKLLIDNNGYPVVDPEQGKLGNPNPNWLLQWQGSLKWNYWKLELNLAYQHGGDRWNGTRAMLDYLGVSRQSADLRARTRQIFSGVNTLGKPNQTPVDFANPANGLAGNRWVRYGVGGIAEDYLDKASSLRIEQIKLTYHIGRFLGFLQTSVDLSLLVQNLLLFTPYQGFDPQSTFLGTPGYKGLDLFNAPATTNWGLQLKIYFQ